ncbi:hypothetical protein DPMN_138082 [Dreissena polymorpha]|uniref:Uncharacterized protein n=1 Tax=Dreissena polymorpha TaxID=45954 RepID=A0A9D4JEA6_DREPO|nr:hypothetical protein DPMN_138082 [Dreissena polymorpha]
MNLLTKFHEDQKINVASRVLTMCYNSHIKTNAPPPGGHVFQPTGIIFELLLANLIRSNAPPLGSHVFQAKVTIFQLIQVIIGTNLLSKFHEDRKKNVASKRKMPRLGKLVEDIIGINLLAKFHEDWTINVASRVKNVPPLGSHVFQANTNLLTKFHEDWTINVASRELTMQMLTPHNGRRTKGDHKYHDDPREHT